jgi:hypothetical protein
MGTVPSESFRFGVEILPLRRDDSRSNRRASKWVWGGGGSGSPRRSSRRTSSGVGCPGSGYSLSTSRQKARVRRNRQSSADSSDQRLDRRTESRVSFICCRWASRKSYTSDRCVGSRRVFGFMEARGPGDFHPRARISYLSLVPQLWQNEAPSSTSAPQLGQNRQPVSSSSGSGSGSPQPRQYSSSASQ